MTRPDELTAFDLLEKFRESTESGSALPPDALLEIGNYLRELGSESDSRASLLDGILEHTGAERAFLVEKQSSAEKSSDSDEWVVLAARSFEHEDIINPADKIIAGLLDPCLDRGQGYFTANLDDEPIAERLRRERQPRSRSVLILPFPEPSTALYLDHRFQAIEFGEGLDRASLTILGWLFTLMVIAETTSEWERTLTELTAQLRDARSKARSRGGAPREDLAEAPPPAATPTDSRGIEGDFSDIIGRHPEVVEILALIAKVAPTQAPILINGESGTGKELVAHAVHKNSRRAAAPFVTENCAALAENLLEAELFGSMKGAYTGAHQDRPGLFELAHGGTLFLDEIGDTTPGLQKKLLRVLQEGTIRRVGGRELIEVDVRVISATNKDLLSEVQAGRFREDLFYRLNVINLILPPLRERREDIPLLAQHFVDQLNRDEGGNKSLTNPLVSTLMVHDWPGNIRELQNEIRRIYALGGQYLKIDDLSPRVTAGTSSGTPSFSLDFVLEHGSLKTACEAWEKQILLSALKRFGGNKAQVSAQLEIPKTTLYAKLNRYGILDA